ncbi:hypothetical protein ACIPQ3_30755 [Streptomyces albidoflavus]
MPQTHSNRPPGECGTCAKIHRVLVHHHRTALGQPLTGSAIAAAAGVARRTSLAHIAHMVASGWVDSDGRTPLVGLPSPAPPEGPATGPEAPSGDPRSPLEWARSAAVSCRTCGRLLVTLATLSGSDWHVRVTEEEVADALRVTGRTARTHLAALTGRRPHTTHPQSAPLLRAELVPGSAGRGGLKFVFLSGETAEVAPVETYSVGEWSSLRERAARILAQVPVAAGMPARERARAADLLLIPRLHVGYPESVLVAAMTEPGDTPTTAHTTSYGLLKWRLAQRAPAEAYRPAVAEQQAMLHDCADCERPFHAPLRQERCGDCRRREAAGISIEVAESHPIMSLLMGTSH